MSDFKKSLKLNFLISKKTISYQIGASIILAGTFYMGSIWLFTILLFILTALLGYTKLYDYSLFSEDAYTLMAVPLSYKDVTLSKLLLGSLETLMMNVITVVLAIVMKALVFHGAQNALGQALYGCFIKFDGDMKVLVIGLQILWLIEMCVFIPALFQTIIAWDKAKSRGKYGYTIIVGIIMLIVVLMLNFSYKPSLLLGLVLDVLTPIVVILLVRSTIEILNTSYKIKNGPLY